MRHTAPEDDLEVVDEAAVDPDLSDARRAEDGGAPEPVNDDSDLESLRDAFVDAFNDRLLEGLLVLVDDDIDLPDVPGDGGAAVFADEVCARWERWPAAILTRATWEGRPCAVAWLPDEDGCWSRAALVLLDADEALLTMVATPDDPDALLGADAEDPTGEELEEWRDWVEWDSGAETPPVRRPEL